MSYYFDVWGKAIVKEEYREDFEQHITKGDWENLKSEVMKEVGMSEIRTFLFFKYLCEHSNFDKSTGVLKFYFCYNMRSSMDCIECMYGSIFPIIFEDIIEINSCGEDYPRVGNEPMHNIVDLIKTDIKDNIEYVQSYCPENGYITYYKSEYDLATDAFFAKWVTPQDIMRFMPDKEESEDDDGYLKRIELMVKRIKASFVKYHESKYYDELKRFQYE